MFIICFNVLNSLTLTIQYFIFYGEIDLPSLIINSYCERTCRYINILSMPSLNKYVLAKVL